MGPLAGDHRAGILSLHTSVGPVCATRRLAIVVCYAYYGRRGLADGEQYMLVKAALVDMRWLVGNVCSCLQTSGHQDLSTSTKVECSQMACPKSRRLATDRRTIMSRVGTGHCTPTYMNSTLGAWVATIVRHSFLGERR